MNVAVGFGASNGSDGDDGPRSPHAEPSTSVAASEIAEVLRGNRIEGLRHREKCDGEPGKTHSAFSLTGSAAWPTSSVGRQSANCGATATVCRRRTARWLTSLGFYS